MYKDVSHCYCNSCSFTMKSCDYYNVTLDVTDMHMHVASNIYMLSVDSMCHQVEYHTKEKI